MSMLDEITVDKLVEIVTGDNPDWRKIEMLNDLVVEVNEYRSLDMIMVDNDCGDSCKL
jgi:hypothetical protein